MKISELVKKGIIAKDHWLTKATTMGEDVEIINNQVIWKKGTWVKGTWENGIWKGGCWEKGTWKSGVWENGIWEKGNWEDGIIPGKMYTEGIVIGEGVEKFL